VDFRGCANQVQVRRGGLFDSGIVLRHNSEKLLIPVQGVQQGQGSFAPDGKGLNASWK
jgi:hypothetical protein